MTGVYGCCDLIRIDDEGNVTLKLNISADAAPILSRGLTYHAMTTPTMNSILSGNALKAVPEIVSVAKEANVTGVVVDYEPNTNYGWEHEEAYMNFLRTLKQEAGASLEVGMDVAGWGILKNLSAYVPAKLDIYTSMYPTYFQNSALSASIGQSFVQSMLETYGTQHVAAGVGSMPVAGYEENCVRMPDYGWDQDGFENFTDSSAGQGLLEIDVWMCDINNYGKTQPWLFEKLSEFLAGGP